MIFRTIEVSQFRKFRGTVTVDGLQDGLNVIAGDNEEGKSTLLTAVRAALFERYKSTVGESFRPYGQNVSPRVRLVFEFRGETWTLEKTFSKLKAGGCRLSCSDGGRWEADEAEDFLKDLLGFEYGSRGSKRELQGLPGLLWVAQGHAYQPVAMADGPRDQLHSVFDAEMTELLGGDGGQAVFDKIGRMRSDYFDKRNNPRGEYKKKVVQVAQLSAQLPDLEDKLRDYDHKLERLEALQSRLDEFRQDNRLAEAEARLKKARDACSEIEAMRASVSAGESKLRQARSDKALIDIAWQNRQKLVSDGKAVIQQARDADEALRTLDQQQAPLAQAAAQAREQLADIKSQHAARCQALEAASAAARFRAAGKELDALTTRLKLATSAEQGHRQTAAQLDAVAITRDELQALRELDQTLRVKTQTLDSAVTRLDYSLEPGARVSQSGQPLTGKGQLQLTRSTDIAMQDVGTFCIQPGGEALPDLQQSIEALGAQLADQLARLGLKSLSEAERAWQEREQLKQQAAQYASVVQAQAPHGVEKLQQQVGEAKEAMGQLARPAPDECGSEAQIRSEIKALEEQASSVEKTVASRVGEFQAQKDHMIERRTQSQSLHDRAAALAADLDSQRASEPDDAIARRLAAANDVVRLAEGELQGYQDRIAAADTESAEARRDAARENLESQEKSLHKLNAEARDLRVELTALGRGGLAEELAQAQIELDEQQRELDHMRARANALDLLHQTMTRNLEAAKTAVARPVIKKMRPYLQHLIPDAEPTLDQDLQLTGLTRDGADEPFERLSIGTREQLAILVRLAYADLLHEHDIPTTVILDDALVNSDDQRRDRMKQILAQAAENYQIIVLTCHERDYRDSAGHRIRLLTDAEHSDAP